MARALPAMLLGAVCLSCSAGAPPPGRPDVVLIVVDTLRADRLGVYGAKRPTSPHIDALAASSVVYRRAYSQAPWTTASVGSLLTSQYPPSLTINDLDSPLPLEVTLLPEVLHDAGYATGAAVSHLLVAKRWGFDQGYDVFDQRQVIGHHSISSPGISNAGIAFVDAHRDRPFFLLLHYFDPHFAYLEHEQFAFKDGSPPYRGWIRSDIQPQDVLARGRSLHRADLLELLRLYDSEIAFTDHHLGRFLDHLREVGLFDASLVIFTADHGEEFLDHGGLSHTRTLYDELVHVPLLVKYPHGEAAVVEQPVALLDVFPTVLDVVGLPAPPELRGHSLRDGAARAPAPIFTSVAHEHHLRAIVLGRWKLIHDLDHERYALYDLEADPKERHDLARRHPGRARDLAARLESWAAANPERRGESRVELSHDDVERLRALGYIH